MEVDRSPIWNLRIWEDDGGRISDFGQSDDETQDAMAEFDLLPTSMVILMVIIQFGVILILNVVQFGIIVLLKLIYDQTEESPGFVIYQSLRLMRVLTTTMTIFALINLLYVQWLIQRSAVPDEDRN